MSISSPAHLVVAVSSRALFDFEDAHQVFQSAGLTAYLRHQCGDDVHPRPGAAFPVVQALSSAARSADAPIEVVVVSRNGPIVGEKIVRAIEHAGLGVPRGAFTGGADNLVPYLRAFGAHLFLTKDPKDAADAVAHGIPAAMMCDPAPEFDPAHDEIRIAVDGDSCLFSDESDRIYEQQGLQAFVEHERIHAGKPLADGPIAPFLRAVMRFQAASARGVFRIALVTARTGAARERALVTLRTYADVINEVHFVGDGPKAAFLEVFKPHLFFDDKEANLRLAARVVPSARVPRMRVTVPNSGDDAGDAFLPTP